MCRSGIADGIVDVISSGDGVMPMCLHVYQNGVVWMASMTAMVVLPRRPRCEDFGIDGLFAV